MKWPCNVLQLTDPIIKLEHLENLVLWSSAGNNIPNYPPQGFWDTHHLHSFFSFLFFLPQDVANNVPRLKKKYQAPYIAFILVALVTILQHSTSSWHDENVRIGRLNGSEWVHLYWHRPFKRYKCVLWDGGCGQKKKKKKELSPHKVCTLTKKCPQHLCTLSSSTT